MLHIYHTCAIYSRQDKVSFTINFDHSSFVVAIHHYPTQQQLYYVFATTCDDFLSVVANPFSCKNAAAAAS